VRKHGASTASRRAAPPSARFQRDRPEVGGVTHIVVVYDIWPNDANCQATTPPLCGKPDFCLKLKSRDALLLQRKRHVSGSRIPTPSATLNLGRPTTLASLSHGTYIHPCVGLYSVRQRVPRVQLHPYSGRFSAIVKLGFYVLKVFGSFRGFLNFIFVKRI